MSLLDPNWKYTHSTATDIRKTFKKARTELAKSQPATVRPAKLHLMPAPSDAAKSATRGARSIPSSYGTRSIAAGGAPNHENNDHPALKSDRLDRRMGA